MKNCRNIPEEALLRPITVNGTTGCGGAKDLLQVLQFWSQEVQNFPVLS